MSTGESAGGGAAAARRLVLIICAANTARSVIAEHLLRRELKALGLDRHIEVASAGVAPFARDGALVSLDAKIALREEGVEIAEETASTALARHPELLKRADLVLAMTARQIEELRVKFPAAAALAVHTLGDFAGVPADIADPYGGGAEAFSACRREIGVLIPRVAERLGRMWPGAQD